VRAAGILCNPFTGALGQDFCAIILGNPKIRRNIALASDWHESLFSTSVSSLFSQAI
jgi:hypothetical protein